MAETNQIEDKSKKYLRNTGISFGVITAVLIAGYLAYTRYDFATLYSGLDIQDASLVAAELDRQEIRYRVGENGSSILVPEQNMEAVRLAVYSSSGPTQGLTGFELFNESEMGLTDFAQKIKFQRAIQGELSRTIMMMDGVKKSRVHVAIPERSVFRSQRTDATAAVTLIAKDGVKFGDDSILGIQRLVASSIPGLSLRRVTVVDGGGRIISKASEVFELAPEGSYGAENLVNVKSNIDSEGVYQLASYDSTSPVVRSTSAFSPASQPELKGGENLDSKNNTPMLEKAVDEISADVNVTIPLNQNSAEVLDASITSPVLPALQVNPETNSKLDRWFFLALFGFTLVFLLGLLFFRRSRSGLTETQRKAFAEELSEALRGADLKAANG